MTNNTEQYRCNRCTMTFRIGEALRCDAGYLLDGEYIDALDVVKSSVNCQEESE
jgi:hypothetical protein